MSRPSTARPTTPIRRISRGSLSALALSQSAATVHDPLSHLEPVIREVADSLEILTENMASLCQINNDLDDFNEAFAGFLFGLKMNAYAVDFTEVRSPLGSLIR
jgi:DASH complex subunit DAM1